VSSTIEISRRLGGAHALGRRAQRADRGGHVLRTEDGRAGDEHVGARFRAQGQSRFVQSAVHLDVFVETLLAQPADLGQHVGHELLTAEAGLDAHHEHEIDLGQDRREHLDRGLGTHRDSDLVDARVAEGLHDLARARGAAGDLPVEGQHVRAGLGEVARVLQRVGDHQVHVERAARDLLDRLDHRRADREVGTKWPSITSTCSQSAPASSTRRISSASRAKSHDNSEGEIRAGGSFIAGRS
jgi:hypothetical protein